MFRYWLRDGHHNTAQKLINRLQPVLGERKILADYFTRDAFTDYARIHELLRPWTLVLTTFAGVSERLTHC